MVKVNFEELPIEVQMDICRILRSYGEVHVTFQHGKYDVGTGLCMMNKYPSDYKFIGSYDRKDAIIK